jgi:hypothetical protein
MMRLLLAGLIVLNVLIFLYGYLGLDRSGEPPQIRRHEPDVGSIRLVSVRVGEPEAEGAGTQPAEPSPTPPPPPEPVAEVQEEVQENVEVPQAASSSSAQSGQDESLAREESAEETEPEPANTETPSTEPPQAPVVETVEEAAEPSEPDVESTPPAPVLVCGEIGPYRTRAQARRVVQLLGADNGVRIDRRPTPVTTAYWVYYPPLPDKASARQVVKRLQAAGVKDLWLMPSGEFKNAISLGLYSRKKAAYDYAGRLREKGFEVEVRPRQKKKERYWIAFSGLREERLGELKGKLPEGVSVTQRECGQGAPE